MRAPCVLGGLLLVLSAPLSAERLDGPPPGLVALASPPLDGEGPPGCVRPDTRRQYTLRFKDLASGELLPDVIENVEPAVAWAADSRTVRPSSVPVRASR